MMTLNGCYFDLTETDLILEESDSDNEYMFLCCERIDDLLNCVIPECSMKLAEALSNIVTPKVTPGSQISTNGFPKYIVTSNIVNTPLNVIHKVKKPEDVQILTKSQVDILYRHGFIDAVYVQEVVG